jgi:HAMP domain-containing protein
MRLSLTLKFNIVFLLIFAVGFAGTAYLTRNLLQHNAEDEILQNARLLEESALAVRGYTQAQIVPLLQTQMKYSFAPQSVPSFSATEYAGALRTKFPDYAYKEATINPTNPRDRATEWETDVVQKLRSDPSITEIVGQRDAATGPSVYIARPIRITDQACLECHSTVDAAPKTMVAAYGPDNGFGWRLNDVIGAQITSVPTSLALGRAEKAFRSFITSFLTIFALVFVASNLMFYFTVTRRISALSRAVDQVSTGQMDVPIPSTRSRDEVGVLIASFERMRTSLASAMKMIDEHS